jgi:hypothetical protein
MTRIQLLIDVPLNADPNAVIDELDRNCVTGQGITITLPNGLKFDCCVADVEVDSWMITGLEARQ